MTSQELIASGLLEAYVLGDGTSEERAMVEQARATDPDVRKELDSLEELLEKHARAHAVQPTSSRRQSVLDAIGPEKGKVLPITSCHTELITYELACRCRDRRPVTERCGKFHALR
jgi:hypothetical protein